MAVFSNKWPSYDQEEMASVTEVLSSGKVNYWTGDKGKTFEKEFASYVGAKHAVAVANGTLALELALHALDIQVGDEIIVPSCTFIATASAVVMRGAIPIVADVEKYSQNISLETIKPHVTDKTKAIICVHLGGYPCDMDPILEFAKEQTLYVIEDCAQAHGAEYKGRKVGSLGDIAAFSFCQDKIMSTGGEGGMLTTNNEAFWRKAWAYKDHGKDYDKVFNTEHPPGFRWLHEGFGTNWRLTEMQSSIGLHQLKKLDTWLQRRAKLAKKMASLCSEFACFIVPEIPDTIKHAFYKFYVFIEPQNLKATWDRDRVMAEINALGTPCFSGSCCEIYKENCFSDYPESYNKELKNAKSLDAQSLMFLVHPTYNDEEFDKHLLALKQVALKASL